MTKITYVNMDEHFKFIHLSSNGEIEGVGSVFHSTPDLVLSPQSNVEQTTLDKLWEKVEDYTPLIHPSRTSDDDIPLYKVPRTVERCEYLEVTDQERDSIWCGLNCVSYKDGLILNSSLHPDSDLSKAVLTGTFTEEGKHPVVLKGANVAQCEGCGSLSELFSVASYDDEGDPVEEGELCQTCRDVNYPYESGDTWYTEDSSQFRNPGRNFNLSYKWGGILDYSFKTTDEERMTCFVKDKSDSKKSPYLGVELEVSCKYNGGTLEEYSKEVYRRCTKGFIANCSDSSLEENDRSFEIKTVPSKLNLLKKELSNLYQDDYLTHDVPDVSSHSEPYGMHIHIDKSSLSKLQLSKLVSFVNAKENRGFLQAIAGRVHNNRYAAYNDGFRHLKQRTTGEGERDGAINLQNSNTVEVRIFHTPKSLEELFIRLEFCDALVLYVKSGLSLSQMGYSYFIDWVKKNNNGYPALKKFCAKLKYRRVDIPIETISNSFSKTGKSILLNAQSLKSSWSYGASTVKPLVRLLKSVKEGGSKYDGVCSKVFDFLKWNARAKKDFLKLLEHPDIGEHAPPDEYFSTLNPLDILGGSYVGSLPRHASSERHFKAVIKEDLIQIERYSH